MMPRSSRAGIVVLLLMLAGCEGGVGTDDVVEPVTFNDVPLGPDSPVEPIAMEFVDVGEGEFVQRRFELRGNLRDRISTISELRVDGRDPAFTITEDGCTGAALAWNESCVFEVMFRRPVGERGKMTGTVSAELGDGGRSRQVDATFVAPALSPTTSGVPTPADTPTATPSPSSTERPTTPPVKPGKPTVPPLKSTNPPAKR